MNDEIKTTTLLENVITYLCFKSNPLSSRKLVKLVYLADLYHQQMFGERLTDVVFIHHKYGAWTPEIETCCEELYNKGVLKEESVNTPKGQAIIPKPAISRTKIKLPDNGLRALECVITDWGNKNPDDVVKFTKTTVPFLVTDFGEAIDFTRSDAIAEYAQKKGIDVEEAATLDVLGNEDFANLLVKACASIKKHGKLLTHEQVFSKR
jgi:hypothetical protein